MILEDYLYKHRKEITKKGFAKVLGITPMRLYRIFHGADIPMSLAVNIVKHTNGEVTLQDLVPDYGYQHKYKQKKKKKEDDQLISGV